MINPILHACVACGKGRIKHAAGLVTMICQLLVQLPGAGFALPWHLQQSRFHARMLGLQIMKRSSLDGLAEPMPRRRHAIDYGTIGAGRG